ncbi:SsrA-binding protein SmpB [Natranaerofaba carboxydovora]|uniref:SsrA-binding protein SmpB n=1 Tax=Natranaerofaba carboxydovora TaxID=2742683 RepID=UPI001F13959A|nr:SsrA-binding protein SmpB [Natranaerofaba carboxydovora]UMZ72792.1 SsrA-binding protein [Natranaerofaba carboxydovora]
MSEAKTTKVLARNKKARHDFFIEEVYEAGIELTGTEVKSAKNGRINLKDGFARIQNGEVYLHNVHISPYEEGNRYNHEPTRTRKLLLHKKEIKKLIGYTQTRGYTLVPLSVYVTRGLIKLELALAKGKQKHDKREAIKRKTMEREAEKALKEKNIR